MKSKFTLFLILFALVFGAQAQDRTKATYVGTVGNVVHVPSIASQAAQNELPPARVKKICNARWKSIAKLNCTWKRPSN